MTQILLPGQNVWQTCGWVMCPLVSWHIVDPRLLQFQTLHKNTVPIQSTPSGGKLWPPASLVHPLLPERCMKNYILLPMRSLNSKINFYYPILSWKISCLNMSVQMNGSSTWQNFPTSWWTPELQFSQTNCSPMEGVCHFCLSVKDKSRISRKV